MSPIHLKKIIEKIASSDELKNNKIASFINKLKSENFGVNENSTYLEKKYENILEAYKDENKDY